MPIEFISKIRPAGQTGDFTSLTNWSQSMNNNGCSDISKNNILVFSGSEVGAIGNFANVQLYSGGVAQAISGTGFVNAASTLMLVSNINNPAFAYTSGEQWRQIGSTGNFFSITSTGDSPIAVAEIDTNWNGVADNSQLDLSVWKTTGNCYIEVRATGYNVHSGVWNTGLFIWGVTGQQMWNMEATNQNTRFRNLQISMNSYRAASSPIAMQSASAGGVMLIDRCIINGTGTTTDSNQGMHGIQVLHGQLILTNSILYGFRSGFNPNVDGVNLQSDSGITGIISNCTIADCGIGIYNSPGGPGASFLLVNNLLVQGCGSGYDGGNIAAGSSFNMCDDSNFPIYGTNSITGSALFLNSGARDYRLSPYDTGAILKGTGLTTFSGDIIGTYRGTANWDIGAYHAPVYTRTIKSSSGHYSNLYLWNQNEMRNLVAVNKIAQAECFPMIDVTGVVISGSGNLGWVSSPTNYVYVYASSGARHSGYWNTGCYTLNVNFDALVVESSYAVIDGLQGSGSDVVFVGTRDLFNQSPITFQNCIAVNPTTGRDINNNRGFAAGGGGNNIFKNCLAMNFGAGYVLNWWASPATGFVYNCVAANCNYGFYSVYVGFTINNSIATNCTSGFVVNNAANVYSGDYNATDSASFGVVFSPTGAHDLSGMNFTFMNSGAGDYRLSPYDTGAILRGTGLTGIMTGDVVGTYRGRANWDIGLYHVPMYIRTIKPSGGHYSSLSAWNAAEQRNLVVSNKISRAECYAMTDTTSVWMQTGSWLTSSGNYVSIYVPTGQRHSGVRVANNSAYLLANANSFSIAFRTSVSWTYLEGVAVSNTGAGNNDGLLLENSGDSDFCYAADCLAYNVSGCGITAYKGNVNINNCIAFSNGVGMQVSAGGNISGTISNCTSINNATGIFVANFRNLYINNCYAGNNTVIDVGSGNTSCTIFPNHSFTSDGSQGLPVISMAQANFTNTGVGTENLTPVYPSLLSGSGVNLSGQICWIEPRGNVDILGNFRGTGLTWDVGAIIVSSGSLQLLNVWPTGDTNVGQWTPTPLWQQIDSSANNDLTYVQSPINPSQSLSEVLLSGFTNPNTYSGYYVQYRFQKSGTNLTNIDLTVALYNGTTLIASGINSGIQPGWITTGFSLTTGQAAKITNFSDLRLRFIANTR